jgi:hypothetical protein
MGCCHPDSFIKGSGLYTDMKIPNICLKHSFTEKEPRDCLDDNVNALNLALGCDCHLSKSTSFNSHDTNQFCNSSEKLSLHLECESVNDVEIDCHFREHADAVLDIIDDMRSHPQKYLNKMKKFLKAFNYKNNSIEVREKDGKVTKIEKCVEPDYVIEFLEKVPSQSSIIKRDGIKFKSNVIFSNPLETLFSWIISRKENIQKLFGDRDMFIITIE